MWARIGAHILVVAGALLALGLWQMEVFGIHRGGYPEWLAGFNWSAIPICLLIAALCSFYAPAPGVRIRRLPFIISMAAISLGIFVTAREAVFELFAPFLSPVPLYAYSQTGSLELTWSFFGGPTIVLLLCALTASIAVGLLAHEFLAPVRSSTWLWLTVVLLSVLPLSVIAFEIISGFDFRGDPIVEAIKLGYPVFWTVFLVPIVLRRGMTTRGIRSCNAQRGVDQNA